MSKRNDEVIEKLVSDFINMQLEYVQYTEYMERKIKNMLIENGIKYQTITSRVKDIESLRKKLKNLGSNQFKDICEDIKKLNDLSGIRVIVYNREQQKNIENLLYDYFKIENNSPEREDYDCKNITISLKEQNISIFKNMKCEVQIVLVLSHALIEFGHDIIYKDKEELKKKDEEGYEQLRKIYDEAFEKIIQIETDMNEIKIRSENIKNGRNSLNNIIDKKYINKIRQANDCNKIGKIVSDLNNILDLLCKDKESSKIVAKNKIILELVKAFVKIPDINYERNNFYFNTYEYLLDQVLEIIQKYIYLYLEDFEEIINLLIEHSNYYTEIRNKIIKTIKNIIKIDKNYYSFSISQIVYNWIITDTEKDIDVKSEIAVEYCNLNLQYAENSGYRQIRIFDKVVKPTTIYKDNIKDVIEKFCIIYLGNQDIALLKKIKLMSEPGYSKGERIENFKLNKVIDFFCDHYNEIDVYIRYELYKTGMQYDKKNFMKTKFYKIIKQDEICNLYAYLFSYFLDDIPTRKHEIVEKTRKNFLDNYVENISKNNEYQIIEICKTIDKYEDELYYDYNLNKFLYDIGFKYENAEKLFKQTDNKVILFGLYNAKDYDYQIKDDLDLGKILKYLDVNKDNVPLKMLNQIIDKINIGECSLIDNYICRIILKDLKLLKYNVYFEFIIKILKYYNKRRKSIVLNCRYAIYEDKEFIKVFKKQKLRQLLINISYKNKEFDDEILLKEVFEIYPDLVREYIVKNLKNCNNNDYKIENFPIEDSSNFNDELENNVDTVLQLLEKYEYYKISKEIRFLVGKYNNNLERCLKKKTKTRKNIQGIVDILKLLDVSTNAWEIFELIIELEPGDDIENEIEAILFSSTGSGEYGLANTFKAKYNFFKNLNAKKQNKNLNVSKFVQRQKDIFYNMYQNERAKTKRRIIKEKEKYNLDNKNSKYNE